MYLKQLHILNFKNIEAATLQFSPKINCLVGQNGMGKTNVLDAVYFLSFCKSAFTSIDSKVIQHDREMAMLQGEYDIDKEDAETITCGIRRGLKKQFRRGKKDYKRLIDHIGLLPLVMLSPEDNELVIEGSDLRRRFIDGTISQLNKTYLEQLTAYNSLLKQRNALLKQYADMPEKADPALFEVFNIQMLQYAQYIFEERHKFIQALYPVFQSLYQYIAGKQEVVNLAYRSQLQDRNLLEAMNKTLQRDLILGWTSQGIHKDDIELMLGDYPLRQVGSQGQQKTCIAALKLAQAQYMSSQTSKPILLLDDIFDKLDQERVEKIIELVGQEQFGQIFITDTDRQHLTEILRRNPDNRLFYVQNGEVRNV